jgi:riboflavin-specific deaminase-like protein
VVFKPLEPVRLRRLHPQPGELSAGEAISDLGFAEKAPAGRPYVVLNMVASADGKAAIEGRTKALGGAADRAIFHHLRTQADAVMVGARTVAIERYPRLIRDDELREKRRREGLAPDPVAVIVSGSLEHLGPDVPLLQDPDQPVLILTRSDAELENVAAPVEYLRSPPGPFDLRPLLHELGERGIRSLLCEGGPMLNSSLLPYGLVDELFLCVAPLLAGGEDALTIVTGSPFPEPVELELIWLLEHEGHLFPRYALQKSLQIQAAPARP